MASYTLTAAQGAFTLTGEVVLLRGGPARVTEQFWIDAASATLPNVAVTQQYWIEANVSPRVHAHVDQQFWIVAVWNKKKPKPRPQVFG